MKMQTNPLSSDLNYILERTLPLWDSLRNQRIFITGGTGFFGCWLLESFVWANERLKLNASAVVLTRNIAQFKKKCPHLFVEPALTFQEGDVKNFEFPLGHFSHIIHAATEASVALNQNNPELMFDTIVEGTQHTLEFARQCGASGFLLTSSGAVYGKQPFNVLTLSEDYVAHAFSLDKTESAYIKGKREAEKLCVSYAEQFKLDIKIARCFAFVGPYLPLNEHFAIGNFIRDGMQGEPIIINSDGSSYRSYLYAADLMVWLWTILFIGKMARPYNVGSNEAYSISDLAHCVAKNFEPMSQVKIMGARCSNAMPERYLPDVRRARDELGLSPHINLAQAIQSTVNWYTHFGR